MRPVLFDCTRLMQRRTSLVATGIDRVDINYLNYFRGRGYPVIGIFKAGDKFVHIPPNVLTTLAEFLTNQWIRHGRVESRHADELNKAADAIKRNPGFANTNNTSARLDPNIIKALRQYGGSAPLYINVSHHGLDDVSSVASLKALTHCEVVLFIHDVIPCDYPEYVRSGDDVKHATRLYTASMLADLIIVNSTYTRHRLQEFFQKEGYFCPPIVTLIIGAEESFAAGTSKGIASPAPLSGREYFVVIGTIEPRKNHLLLLNIWRQWYADSADETPYLVIIGKRGWNNNNIIDMLTRPASSKERVLELSDIPDDQMIGILRGSIGLAFPSFVEGWGMPLAEALSLGVPAVCSDTEVFRQCGQDRAIYLDPLDGIGWYTALRRLKSDTDFREYARALAAQYHPPSWAEHFSGLDDALKGIVRRRTTFAPRSSLERQEAWANYQTSVKARAASSPRNGRKTNIVVRRLRKLRRDPVRYLADSKSAFLRGLAARLKAKKDD